MTSRPDGPVGSESPSEEKKPAGEALAGSQPRSAIDMLRRVLGSTASFRARVASTLGAQGLLLVVGIFQGAIVARLLGPVGKGQLALALLVAAIFLMFLNPGFNSSYVYFTGSGRWRIPDLTRHATAVGVLTLPIGLGLALLLAVTGVLRDALPGVPTALVLTTVGLLPVTIFFSLLVSILTGQQRIHLVNRIAILDGVASAALGVGLLLAVHAGPTEVIVGNAAGDGLAALVAAGALRPHGGRFVPQLGLVKSRALLSYGLRAQGGNLVQFLNYRLDQLILNLLTGTRVVGIYSVSARVAELVWELPNSVSNVLFAKGVNEAPEQMNRFTPRVARWTLALSVLPCIVLAVGGHALIGAVYSSKFLGAYVPLLWLLPGTAVFGVATVLAHDLAGRGHPGYNGLIAAVSLVFTVAFDLIFIPRFGASGAAIASSISYVVTTLFTLAAFMWVIRREREGGAPHLEPAA